MLKERILALGRLGKAVTKELLVAEFVANTKAVWNALISRHLDFIL